MKIIASIILIASFIVCTFAQGGEFYESQRICWKKDECVSWATPIPLPDGNVIQPSDGSVSYPYVVNSLATVKQYYDQNRLIGILARNDVDVIQLNYNHSAGQSVTELLLSSLLVLGTDQTENVNVVYSIFGAASLPVTLDGEKVVSEDVIRSHVADAGTPLPYTIRLLGSARLITKDRAPTYTIAEHGFLNYFAPLGYTNGCSIKNSSVPISETYCDYSDAIIVNPDHDAFPSAGTFYAVLYEEKGKPTPYILSTGSLSFLNYLFGAPTTDFANVFYNYKGLLDVAANIISGLDMVPEFDLI